MFWCRKEPSFFVDYFILRQCKMDFLPERVEKAIAEIGHTVIVLDPHVRALPPTCKPEAIDRVWCCYEMCCTIKCKAKISGVLTSPGFWCLDPFASDEVDVRLAKALWDGDKQKLLDFLGTMNVDAAEKVNANIQGAIQRSCASATEQLLSEVLMSCFLAACIAVLAYICLFYVNRSGFLPEQLVQADAVLAYVVRQLILLVLFGGVLVEMKTSTFLSRLRLLCEALRTNFDSLTLLSFLQGCAGFACLLTRFILVACFGTFGIPLRLLRHLRKSCKYDDAQHRCSVGPLYTSKAELFSAFAFLLLCDVGIVGGLWHENGHHEAFLDSGNVTTMPGSVVGRCVWFFVSLPEILVLLLLLLLWQQHRTRVSQDSDEAASLRRLSMLRP